MKGIHTKTAVAALLALVSGLVLFSSLEARPARAAGSGFLQKHYIELNKKISPAVVAVVIEKRTWCGFFISKDGLLITTGSIAENQRQQGMLGSAQSKKLDPFKLKPTVLFADGRSFEAKVIGYDRYNNIALLKASGKNVNFPFLKLGSSKDLKVGRQVATVGNVYASINNDSQTTFSIGTTTAKFRLIGTEDYKGCLVETSASINPGGEGGPIVDLNGKVVAVACKNYSQSRFQGAGIPIDQIKIVLGDLKRGKKIVSGYFGATFEKNTISKVALSSPAAKAGMKTGDIITEIDSVFVKTKKDILTMLRNTPAGATTNIFVKRGDKEILLSVTYGKGIVGKEIEKPPVPQAYLGLALKEESGKIFITGVASGSPAARAKLKAGPQIIEINGQKVNKLADFEAIFKKFKPGDTITLRLQQPNGFKKTFRITLTKKAGKDF